MSCENKTKPLLPPLPPKGLIGPRIGRVAKVSTQNFNKAVSEQGLFAGQPQILMLLENYGKLTVSDIAKETGVAYSTASVSIKRLEKAGFVVKKTDKNDARIVYIYLTEKGKSVPENIKQKLDSQENIITRGMTEEEVMLLSDLLDKVAKNYESEICNND